MRNPIAAILCLALAGCASSGPPIRYIEIPPAEIAATAAAPCFNTWDIPHGSAGGCSKIIRDATGAIVCELYYPASAAGSWILAVETNNCRGVNIEIAKKAGLL